MLKKVLIMLMAAIMLVGCVACGEDKPADPTPEPTPVLTGDPLIDNLFFNADFSKGTVEDSTGNSKATQTLGENGAVEFVEEDGIGQVANIKNTCIAYDVDLEKMGKTFTMEAYVRTERQTAFGVICGTYYHTDKAGVSFVTGMFPDPNKPFGSLTHLSIVSGTLMSTRTVETGRFRQWNHLVFVHDGENGKQHFYINGVEVEGFEGGVTVNKSAMKHSSASGGFKIGAYNTLGQFAVEDMKLSFVRMYDFAADSASVTKMYEACPQPAAE